MQLLAANNAQTVLAAGINASATAITVSSGAGVLFPVPVSGTSLFKLSLTDAATESVREIVHVTSVSGDVFTVVRGQEGTSARSWSANDIAANMVTAGTLSFFAQLDSPVFTGDPKAPTAAAGDNDTTIATTAFVTTAVQGLAPIASPIFTGDPRAPTPASGDNDTSIATTQFVTRDFAKLNGDSNVTFYAQKSDTSTAVVNNQRLADALALKANLAGNATQGFSVAGGTNPNSAVAYNQFITGSNGNGAYIRFPTGAQWCRTNITVPAGGNATWNFPSGFVSPPAVFITNINGDQALWPTGVGSTGTQIYNSTSQNANVNLLAIY